MICCRRRCQQDRIFQAMRSQLPSTSIHLHFPRQPTHPTFLLSLLFLLPSSRTKLLLTTLQSSHRRLHHRLHRLSSIQVLPNSTGPPIASSRCSNSSRIHHVALRMSSFAHQSLPPRPYLRSNNLSRTAASLHHRSSISTQRRSPAIVRPVCVKGRRRRRRADGHDWD